MLETILWHDYETFGANPALDRPSQFAAIRTTLDLGPVDDPVMLHCSPSDDVIPDIDACLITGITPQEARDKGVFEPAFIAKIHSEFMRPGTCGAGYNSIRFDDEVTRHCLYRNFYDPYAREWQNGNSRWDIIDMVRAACALRPDGIEWPESEPGVPSFRLELLTAANQLEHGSAHDALSDVRATISLAKLIRDKQPKLYNYLWEMRDKTKVAKQLNLVSRQPVVHVSSKIPASRFCTTVVMPLLRHPQNSNGIVCVDLCVDPDVWIHMSGQEMLERLYIKTEDLEEGQQRLPLKTIHLNRSPVVAPLSLLDEAALARLDINLEECERHWQKLLARPELASKVVELFDQPFDAPVDVEASLYAGFIPREDRAVCDKIIGSSAEELAAREFVFSDDRLTELFFRYRARHFPDSLTPDQLALWNEEVAHKYLQPSADESSFYQNYMMQLNERRSGDNSKRDQSILDSLNSWMLDFHQRYSKA